MSCAKFPPEDRQQCFLSFPFSLKIFGYLKEFGETLPPVIYLRAFFFFLLCSQRNKWFWEQSFPWNSVLDPYLIPVTEAAYPFPGISKRVCTSWSFPPTHRELISSISFHLGGLNGPIPPYHPTLSMVSISFFPGLLFTQFSPFPRCPATFPPLNRIALRAPYRPPSLEPWKISLTFVGGPP